MLSKLAPEERLENNFYPPWETKQVLLTFLTAFLVFFGLCTLLGVYLKYLRYLGLIGGISRSALVNSVWGDLVMLFYFILLALTGYFFILKKIQGAKLKFFVNFTKIKKDLSYAFVAYLLSFSAAFLLGIIIVIGIVSLASLFHQEPSAWIKIYSEGLDIERAQVIAHLGLLKVVLLIFIAPLIEELFFRGCLYGALRKNNNVFFSIATSSLLFALMHGYLFNFIYILLMGFVSAWLYERRRSLTAPVFFHFLWNLQVYLITIFTLARAG